MIIHLQSATKEEFRHRFEEVINKAEKHDMRLFGFSISGSLEGSINGDEVSFLRTAGLFSNMPQRRFSGTLSIEKDRLIIKGSFRFSKLFFCFLAAIGIVILLFLLLTYGEAFTIGTVIKIILISTAIPTFYYFFCVLASLPFEKEAIRILESL